MAGAKNVLGKPLQSCSFNPMTGWFRNGCCETGPGDFGIHVVCCQVTEEFLAFSKKAGNDLTTPIPEYEFPGLKPGDRWCLCAERYKEAYDAGVAPGVVLAATHMSAIEFATLEELREHAVDLDEVEG
ncbi:DUF2237 family protein [Planctomicrobium sp. SH664]|uniref:DUF2237 family protein n=1 Tax=Planctomicrobium sp. SH664 TaxID=3448125 RepID=UPI003F5B8EDB